MANSQLDHDIQEELSEISEKYPVFVATEQMEVNSFSGTEIILLVLSFTVSAVADSVLSELGKEIWEKIKSVAQKVFRKRAKGLLYEVQVRYPVKIKGRQIEFTCKVTQDDYSKKLDLFFSELQKETLRLSKAKKKSGGARAGGRTYELLENGFHLVANEDVGNDK